MKIFQIENNFCYVESPYSTMNETVGNFPPTLIFVEAPDYVFPGWGYINGEFIKPTAPEGFVYDEKTGTFHEKEELQTILKQRYNELSQRKIRQRYTATDEYKVLREYLANKEGSEEQFGEYNNYVELCKLEAYKEIYGD